jgi:tetratricopeptide (TPR) repeat protein
VAYSILGSFYRSLASVGWFERQVANVFLGGLPAGGVAEAEQALRKAIELSPKTMRHHYELGMLYMEHNRRSEARKAFEAAQQCPILIASDRWRLSQVKKMIAYIDEQLR